MATLEQIYELVKAMPADQVDQVWDFVEFLQHKTQVEAGPRSIPLSTLTGLRQLVCAVLNQMDAIITRDQSDFAGVSLPV